MRILLLASAFNSLTQRVYAELADRGHSLDVHLAVGDDPLRDAVRRHAPELIIAPMLKADIPRDVRSAHTCLIVHPGPPGDRGPSGLDWAIHEGRTTWGVTVRQAEEEMDRGPVWAFVPCPLPPAGKSDLYRNEISDAALTAVLRAVDVRTSGGHPPRPRPGAPQDAPDRPRPYLDQRVRGVDWRKDTTATVVRKLRAADSRPGVLDTLCGEEWFLHGGHPEDELRGVPGALLATRAGAVCRATVDGAVWIPELRRGRRAGGPLPLKLPATLALGARPDALAGLPEAPAPLHLPEHRRTWSDIRYAEDGPVGFLRFAFPGGAMSTDHCRRLSDAYRYARSRPTSVLVLGGGRDVFAGGLHLHVIEAAADPAKESWANVNAMHDLVERILTTTDRLVVAAIGGNAAAGGAMLAMAADEVWCRGGSLLNPHYRRMGLHGSEYWTYSLPRRVGRPAAVRLTQRAIPVTPAMARRIGLVDRVLDVAPGEFAAETVRQARALAATVDVQERIAAKKAARDRDEAVKPLAAYRVEELELAHKNFFGRGEPYHALRAAFVRERPVRTAPPHLGA
ncbi:hydrogenase maturation protein [Streptomyces sp. NRRL F-5135]|uniref:hydrogenase maturation protein n=1 Tax=Streptomyces sp. NRRL F-5135 TaxID=1463858 RepID=UPI0004C6E386|nr:hydrogenase maturation protein [Streptomyces sp. NRRL F-5135]